MIQKGEKRELNIKRSWKPGVSHRKLLGSSVFCFQMLKPLVCSLPIWRSGCRSLPLCEILSLSASNFQTPGSSHWLLWPLLCAPKSKNLLGGGMKGMKGVLECSGRQGNMAHPFQHVLLLWALLPTLVLGWAEGSARSEHSDPWTQAPASILNSLETVSLPQQLLMSLHHSPNSPAAFS